MRYVTLSATAYTARWSGLATGSGHHVTDSGRVQTFIGREYAMKTEVLNVTGMTCGGCVASVRRALTALPGIAGVVVSLPRQQAEVQFDETKLSVDAMRIALQSAGYDVATAPTEAEHRVDRCCS